MKIIASVVLRGRLICLSSQGREGRGLCESRIERRILGQVEQEVAG
jgi:hypothetical protein